MNMKAIVIALLLPFIFVACGKDNKATETVSGSSGLQLQDLPQNSAYTLNVIRELEGTMRSELNLDINKISNSESDYYLRRYLGLRDRVKDTAAIKYLNDYINLIKQFDQDYPAIRYRRGSHFSFQQKLKTANQILRSIQHNGHH